MRGFRRIMLVVMAALVAVMLLSGCKKEKDADTEAAEAAERLEQIVDSTEGAEWQEDDGAVAE